MKKQKDNLALKIEREQMMAKLPELSSQILQITKEPPFPRYKPLIFSGLDVLFDMLPAFLYWSQLGFYIVSFK